MRDMPAPLKLKIELPNIPDIELIAIDGLERLASHMGMPTEQIGEAKIMLTEAIINALEHGGSSESRVEAEFTVTPTELVIFVRDFGRGFEASKVVEPKIDEKIGSNYKRGWGLKLMKEMSDDLKIESDETGTRITIKKLIR